MHSDDAQPNDNEGFLYPRRKYYGKFSPENLVFNANLQEFAQQVTYLCALETGGKIPPNRLYQDINLAWKALKRNKKGLGIGDYQAPPNEQV